MKRKNADATAKAQRKSKSPVPAWADPELNPAFEKMRPDERIACAERLEHQAAQLREMKPAPVKDVCTVSVPLKPKMKMALLAFAGVYGANSEPDENSKLQVGARWFLESALPMISAVSDVTDRRIGYRKTEDVEDTDYCERLTDAALEKWLAEFKDESDED